MPKRCSSISQRCSQEMSKTCLIEMSKTMLSRNVQNDAPRNVQTMHYRGACRIDPINVLLVVTIAASQTDSRSFRSLGKSLFPHVNNEKSDVSLPIIGTRIDQSSDFELAI
ncbi:hypothetical protein AVEN_169376-1 [Araneus ventricosus]|uniref:Uncharacterized protein n=1 Tax=Araneus ventricosus TaxID=182803 RepID=A0A4Y2LDG4_ARAVE|nr:hypothetical protein AVEN_169376-1 [Araneus ventricosus]